MSLRAVGSRQRLCDAFDPEIGTKDTAGIIGSNGNDDGCLWRIGEEGAISLVTVKSVEQDSIASRAGILEGDILLQINGHDIRDVLDYRFYLTEKKLELLLHRGPELIRVSIHKEKYADIGLDFETYLMDREQSCRNKCVFCFIDQLPPGMRKSLYFKDDDTRMSFLLGNYVTLTNLSEADIQRIVQMKTSPINISVHTTNPELRVKMMKNRKAGQLLSIMKRFAAAGIVMNCQIVLCRGLNDGAELDRSMRDLEALYPHVPSVSIVPSGLTDYREGLYPLEPFSREECRAVIKQVEEFSAGCFRRHHSRIFFAADEWYVRGRVPIPKESYYEGFPQLENGVGMIRSMKSEFDQALGDLSEYDLHKKRRFSLATGYAAYQFIRGITETLMTYAPETEAQVFRIRNDFFGHRITVAGLITGQDLCRQLKGKDLGERLFLPSVMLRRDGDVFLDDMTPAEVSEALGVPLYFTENDGFDFVRQLLY